MIGAVLIHADLNNAIMESVNLHDANLFYADLSNANLVGATLHQTNLNFANMTGANLLNSNLEKASLIETNLTNATIRGARIYGISAWGIKTEGIVQQNLVITSISEPEITVDNLEVAQFVYLLLNNYKLRDVIESVTSKAVLILGRFSKKRKKNTYL